MAWFNDFPVSNEILQVNRGAPLTQQVPAIRLAATAGITTQFSYLVTGGDFLWCYSIATATSEFTHRIEIRDEGSEYIDNDQVYSPTFWGTGAKPNRHPPKFLRNNSEIVFTISNVSAVANTIYLTLAGFYARCEDKCYPGDRNVYGKNRGLFCLVSPWTNNWVIPAGSTSAPVLNVPKGNHLRSSQHNATTAAGAQTWAGTASWRDVRDQQNRNLSVYRIPAASWSGSGTDPYRWPSTPIFYEGSAITYDLVDTQVSGGDQDLYVTHVCERIPLYDRVSCDAIIPLTKTT